MSNRATKSGLLCGPEKKEKEEEKEELEPDTFSRTIQASLTGIIEQCLC